MIYLDNAATSMPKPDPVYTAVLHAMKHCASVGRSAHKPAIDAAETVYGCRKLAAELFDADVRQVVMTMNTTHGLNIAIKSLVKPGDRVVVSGFEHNAVLRPLYKLGADIHVAGTKLFRQEDAIREFSNQITEDTAAVICTHVSNVFGYVLPIEEIAAICLDREIPLIIDAAQSAGVLPISMKKLQASYIAMPGHKALFGPQGTGILLCGRMPESLIEGGTGSFSQHLSMPDDLPDRVEAGTHNVSGIAGLLEGLRHIKTTGVHAILQREKEAAEILKQELNAIAGLECFSGENQTGVLSFRCSQDCEMIADALAQMGIAVRAGLHCAPLAHRSAGTLHTGTVRISASWFTTNDDLTALINGLRNIIIS